MAPVGFRNRTGRSFFALDGGLISGGGFKLGIQALGSLSYLGWAATFILLFI
jgi:Amt family ammonium transporter